MSSDSQTYGVGSNPVTVVFSEPVTSPTISVSTGGAQSVSGSGTTWTFSYTSPAATFATETITISAAADLAGNAMSLNSAHIFTVDTANGITSIGLSSTSATGATIAWGASYTATNAWYRISTTANNGTWTVAPAGSSGSISVAGLSANTLYYYQLRLDNGSLETSSPLSFTTAAANTGLAVESIAMTKSYATADNSYANGWEWKYTVTVNNPSETNFAMKFAQWTSGSNTIDAAGNMRYAVDANNDGVISGAGPEAWTTITANATYPTSLTLTGDNDATRGGRQVTVFIQTKVPVATA